MKNYILGITLIIAMISCNSESYHFEVKYFGALKKMMHEGDISTKTSLKDFENIEHLYALGAFENLKGEIQIFDGDVFNTMVLDNEVNFDKTFKKNATLFVYASVSHWESISIPEHIVTYEQLEAFIDKSAKDSGINTNEPFPFLIDGTPKSFDWHVINWKDGDTEHSHEKHINSGLNGTIKNTDVNMLGFYSNSHHAIFTHHTTNMHIHFKTTNGNNAGHVDGLTLGKGMVLKLPQTK